MTTNNLVANGNFATGDFTDWTLGGNYTSGQIFIDTNAEGGSSYAAGMGSMGSDGTLSQTIATTAGQTYTLSFWLQNEGSSGNDFTAMWDGQPLLALTNASAFGYTEYTFTVTAIGSTSTLEFSAANGASQWNLDNVSLTSGSSTAAPAAPAINSGGENSNQSVTLTGTAPDGATVTVWDGATALGTTIASSTGAWSFATASLSFGSYAFTATDATSAGTSAASSPLDVTVTTPPAPLVINTGVENSNQSVTLTGTAPDGATVTVSTLTTSNGLTTELGTTTASSTGAWSFTTTALSAGVYDFTATDTTSAGTSAASSPLVVGVSSTNPDPVTYYVSSEIGSDNNAGTSATAPLASLQAAANLVKPGDTVEVMNGTYTGNAPGGGDVLDITTSGTASAPITFEAAPGQTPVINSSGGWNAINIEASYIVVNGFTVVGDAANYTLSQALAGYSSGNANLDGNGIAVEPNNGVVSNHITIENNTVYNEPGAGILTQTADYVQILNNVVYDNAHWSAWGESGISVAGSANSDTNPGVHDIISGNTVYGNAQLVPTTGGNTITDGEGIILDTNTGPGATDPGYVGEFLVENNTVYNNGSSGIESFLTNNAVITGNTSYGNDTENLQAASNAEIFINQSSNNTVTDNSTTAPAGSTTTPPAAPVISTGVANSNETVTLTGTAPDGSTVTVSDGGGKLGTATANSSTGAWSFTTAALSAGSYAFTATDTTSAGTSAASSPLDVTVTSSSPTPSGPNLVANGNFATGNFTDWTLGGNYTSTNVGPEIFIDTNAEGGSTYAAGMGSMGSDGTLSQTIATTAAQTYALSFWLENDGGSNNDFKAIWNGQTLLSLTNAAASGYTEYTYTVTATSSTTTLEFSAANPPSQWDLDNVSLTPVGSTTTAPAAPIISTGVANSNETVTLTGTAPDGSTVTVSDGGTSALGTTTASNSGAWSFTTAALSAGSYAFTATDTTSAGTSAASSALDVTITAPPPAAPVISTGVANSNDTVTLTGTAPDGSTVTVSDGGTSALGTTTASSSGAWSFTTAALSAGSYGFTATDTTSAGTSAASSALDVTVTAPPPAAPVISTGVANSNETVTLTGTAPDGSTVTVSDGGTGALGTSTASSSGAWSFTTAALSAGSYAFTATDTTSAGTSAASSALDVTVTAPPPAAPVISTGVANSNETVTLTGTAPDGSTVTVSDGGTSALGTSTASSSGAWSFTTAALSAGSYAFTATDTTSAGTSAASSALDVTVTAPPPAAPVISTGVANSNETVTLTGTAPDGSTVTVSDGGTSALGTSMASSSGAWSFTTAALSAGSYAFTATDTTSAGTSAASSALDVTVTAPPPAAPVISTGVANSNETVTLTGTAPDGSTVTVSDGGTSALGTSTASSSGAWSFTTAALSAGSYAFTATDTTSAGTSAASSALDVTVTAPPPAAPVISTGVANSNETVTLTGTAPDGSTVTVSDGGTGALGTSMASSSGAWSFTTAALSAGSYAFTATDTTSAGTSAASSALDVTVTAPPPAAPVISTGVANSNETVTLTGTAPDGSTVTVSDGGTGALGTSTASSSGAWSFTTAALSAGSYAFTATDTTSAGTSAASSALDVTVTAPPPAAPVISTGVANSNETVTLTGTAPDGSTVTVSDGGTGALGTSTASSSGAWSFTTAALSAGSYSFTATDMTSAGTSAASSALDVTVTAPPPAAPVISTGVANSNETVTLTGTAPDGSTVTVSDGGTSALGTSTASSSGAWSFTTAALSAGSYAFTATDTTSEGTSAGSSPFDVTVTSSSPSPPVAPVIETATVNSNTDPTVTFTGTAPDGSTVTVSDGGTTPLGTGTASSTGGWTFTTADLAAGSYAFTATDTTSAGTSAASSPFDVTVTSSLPPPASNLVANGNFATGDFTDWTLGGNYTSGQIFIDTNAEGGSSYAAGMGSMGSDGSLSQTIATTAGQTYTLSFWLQNEASDGNDFTAMWDGQPLLALTNASAFGYTEYTFTVTAIGSTSTLEFSAANGASQWNLDNVSLTSGSSTAAPAAPAINSGGENSNQSVTLTGTAPDGATVTVWDGATALGTTIASSTGAWSFATASLSFGSYAFTATDATSAGTSAASSPLDVTVTTPPAPLVINTGVENSNQSVTLTGTAPDGATVTVSTLTTSNGLTTELGTTTASSTGAWSFTTTALSAGVYDFTATDTTSAGTSAASSPLVVGVSSTNPDPVTYYVSSEIGSDNNAGTSATAPLASLQAAANLVKPGDTVEVMNGTYTGNAPGGGDVLDITTSGTASAPITFEAAPGQTPVINSSGGWNAINIEASYIVVNGFTVVGDAANYTLSQALAGYSSGNANLDGNGIAVEPNNGVVSNHITIENNTVYNEPGAGILTQTADYVQILNNVVYDNAHWSAWGESGISVAGSANSDTNPGVHDIISGNTVYGNAQLVPTTGGNTITDGEGIILDTNTGPGATDPGYVGEFLVENNTVYNNGSSGIESFLTNNAVITGNTSYGNDTENLQAASNAEIFINQSSNNTVTDNSTTAPAGSTTTPPAAPVISTGVANSNETVTLTGTAPDGSTVTVSDGGGKLGTATANSSTGAWSFTTAALSAGSYAFTATDTTSAGTSAASSPLDVTVTSSSPTPSGPNLVANGNFATGNFTDWTLGGNYTSTNVGPEIFIDTNAEGGSTYAAGMGSMGSDGTLSQTIATTAAQTYALSFWLENDGGSNNDFKAIWNGQTLLSLTNATQFGYTEYTYTVTATGSTSTLEFAAQQNPSQWDLDNVSLTANGTTSSSPPSVSSIAESPASGDLDAGKTVTLTLKMSENVIVNTARGTPTLTLNDGGTATYTSGSGTSALTFTYKVAADQNTPDLSVTKANLNGATITNGGNAANLSLTGLTQTGPQIDTTAPPAPIITSDEVVGKRVVLSGTEAQTGTTISIYDGSTLLGTTKTGTNGTWVFVSKPLTSGAHTFTATATDAAGNVSAPSAPLDPDIGAGPQVSAAPVEIGNQFYIYNSSGSGLAVSYTGSTVTAGEFGSWTPIAATQTINGYEVAWKNTTSGQYTVWSTDSNGNYTGNLIGAVSGNSYALESFESVFNQDLNGDGTIGPTSTLIQTDGSTSLTELANQYFSLDGSNGSDPILKYNAANVSVGQFGGWTPIGAVQTASGYDIAWKMTGANEYTVWSTDSNGNYTGNLIGAVSGNSYALESFESVFNQDLNGDGTIGPTSTLIQTDGSTSLTELANQYFSLDGSNGSDPILKYNAANVSVGQFGGWTPIGAVQTASGYDIAWKMTGANEYTVWSTDSNGNYTGNLIGAVSGNSYALESFESVFNQDLNGDGTIGPTSTLIQTDGSTSLTELANQYFSLDGSNGSDPILKYNAANVSVGQFGGWTPIGAVQTASGSDIAWKMTGANEYTVWSTDSNGNYTGNLIGAVSGTSTALETFEPIFGQDLNGDGVIGLNAAPGAALQVSTPLAGPAGAATIGAGATLEISAADSSSVTFASSTGLLKLDNPLTFTGEIFNFTGNGQLSGSDQIDLNNIKFNSVQDSYANGVLTIKDGSGDTDKLDFNGSYSLANFDFASDGSGGTIVYDPPVPSAAPSSDFLGATYSVAGQNGGQLPAIAFDAQPTLAYASRGDQSDGAEPQWLSVGSHGPNVAHLINYMASSFAMTGDDQFGTTIIANTAIPGQQSLLSTPHH